MHWGMIVDTIIENKYYENNFNNIELVPFLYRMLSKQNDTKRIKI